jgi:hypothetical protein
VSSSLGRLSAGIVGRGRVAAVLNGEPLRPTLFDWDKDDGDDAETLVCIDQRLTREGTYGGPNMPAISSPITGSSNHLRVGVLRASRLVAFAERDKNAPVSIPVRQGYQPKAPVDVHQDLSIDNIAYWLSAGDPAIFTQGCATLTHSNSLRDLRKYAVSPTGDVALATECVGRFRLTQRHPSDPYDIARAPETVQFTPGEIESADHRRSLCDMRFVGNKWLAVEYEDQPFVDGRPHLWTKQPRDVLEWVELFDTTTGSSIGRTSVARGGTELTFCAPFAVDARGTSVAQVGAGNSIAISSLEKNGGTKTREVPLGFRPKHLVMSPDGGFVGIGKDICAVGAVATKEGTGVLGALVAKDNNGLGVNPDGQSNLQRSDSRNPTWRRDTCHELDLVTFLPTGEIAFGSWEPCDRFEGKGNVLPRGDVPGWSCLVIDKYRPETGRYTGRSVIQTTARHVRPLRTEETSLVATLGPVAVQVWEIRAEPEKKLELRGRNYSSDVALGPSPDTVYVTGCFPRGDADGTGERDYAQCFIRAWQAPKSHDRDGDFVVDKKDKCVDVAEDFDDFEDEDGCPEPDNDRDAIPDRTDHCPNTQEDKDGVFDEDGCPETDGDRDTIPDTSDKCPTEPETFNGTADSDGCPDKGNVVR